MPDILYIFVIVYAIIMFIAMVFLLIRYIIDSTILARNPTGTNVYVKESKYGGKSGRGVFANRDFESGEIIELTPYIEDDTLNFTGAIRDYSFHKEGVRSVVALGYISLCNHMDDPNAMWKVNDTHLVTTAIKPIKKDEEIFITYGVLYWKVRKGKIDKVDPILDAN
jgi:hypothetical protein